MMLIGVLLTVAGVAAMIAADFRDRPEVIRIAKPLASVGFLATWWFADGPGSSFGLAVGLGLAASFVGDVALLSTRARWFMTGLVAFAAAHIAYAVAFGLRGVDTSSTLTALALLGAPAVFVDRWLHPKVPADMAVPVRVYIVLITVMVAMAWGCHASGAPGRLFWGAVAFYVSDLAVARDRFVTSTPLNRVWGWPLYYGAQLLLAAG